MLPAYEAAGSAGAHEDACSHQKGQVRREEESQQQDHAAGDEKHCLRERDSVCQVRDDSRTNAVQKERGDVAQLEGDGPIAARVGAERSLGQVGEAPEGKGVHGEKGGEPYRRYEKTKTSFC